ncbi:WD domain-containing protein [Histoplasma capsulatum G186AR]|uniref:WD domain-containing protein n=2 Tax=Ajellomyces capsulatus TaxID=5037 RepID=C0NFL0_AJECG|nr:WD domain-containing protein [Histoplasma capsulatum G186AR]EEH10031.1 WD domain-containing protein [Histoplasma capsulatum G186AR]KAG5291024.1 WD domain-containing protein [Histoplasma capsulatum]QSS72952.1 WD domain-containing protein [Histoplasma capsulatum G186AR]
MDHDGKAVFEAAAGNGASTSHSSPVLQPPDARKPSRTSTASTAICKDEESSLRNNIKPLIVKSHTTTSIPKSPSVAASPSLPQLPLKLSTGIGTNNQPQALIDPLSEHILQRTNTDKSNPPRLRPYTKSDAQPGGSEYQRPFIQEDFSPGWGTNLSLKNSKDKKKGVSFLSRIIGSKKKTGPPEWKDDVSETGEIRATGMDAEVFAQPIGFIPRYPPPPKYIKVRSRHKKDKDFNRLFIAQELYSTYPSAKSQHQEDKDSSAGSDDTPSTGKAIWALEFSKDGKFFAAAGQDKKVRIWAVIATREDRQAHEIEEEAQNDKPFIRLRAPVFKSQPVREYEGHSASIVDLTWSKNNFLLSTSMDKTVRLWHVTRNECLCCFNHSDFVTSVQFHPQDDRFFLAGSLDTKLRLWSIPDKSVAFVATLPYMITSVAFTPDGKHSIAGCLNGLCLIFETDGLNIQSQIHVRSARGRNAKGSKITGIDAISLPPNDPNGSVKLLITSNDSRIRLYNFRYRTLEAKFRGNENHTSQIRATFSSDGKYVICGSEDRKVYIWPISSPERDPEKRAVEIFESHSSIVTSAIMAPAKSKQLLGTSGDLLYDLCNPPPVTLVSQAVSVTSKPVTDAAGSREESMAPTPRSSTFPLSRKADELQAPSTKFAHPCGNIIIAADAKGTIKAFRQDCGYHKLRSDVWDTGFSRRILGRNNSVSTRHSISSSIGKDSSHKTPSERILSWRNAVMRTENSSVDNLRSSLSMTRSVSPSKFPARQNDKPQQGHLPIASDLAGEPSRRSFTPTFSLKQRSIIDSPFSGAAPSEYIPQPEPHTKNKHRRNEHLAAAAAAAATATNSHNNLLLSGNQSYMYWNKDTFASQASGSLRPVDSLEHDEGHPFSKQVSRVSTLSSDIVSTSEEEGQEEEKYYDVHDYSDGYSNENEETEEEEEEEEDSGGDDDDDDDDENDGESLICSRCQGANFRAMRMKSGDPKLICVECRFPAP